MSLTVHAALRAQAQQNPLAPALIHDGQAYTREQFQRLIAATAQWLRQQGIAPMQAVGLSMGRSPLHMAAMIAIGVLGAYSIPVNPALSVTTRRELARKFALQALVTDREGMETEHLRVLRLNRVDVPAETVPASTGPEVSADTPFRVILTSGTTGVPKGILFSHATLMPRMARAIEGCSADTRLVPPDLHISIGTLWPLATLCQGGVLVFPRTQDFRDLVSAVQLHAVTHVVMSPWAAGQLVSVLPTPGQIFPGVRHFRLVGAAPSAALLRGLIERVSPHVHCQYALTEIGTLTQTTPAELLNHPGSSGRLRADIQARVMAPDGRTLPHGETGELCFAVTPMPKGYHGDEDITRHKFREGWFHTGDLGYITPEGLLYVQGRLDELLNLGGHKYHPQVIEDALCAHPQVQDAAAFLWPDERGEPAMAAAVVLRGNVLPQDLANHAQKALGAQAAPRRYLAMPQLPRNPSGKLMRSEILNLVAAAWQPATSQSP